jgi:hypothetical protein
MTRKAITQMAKISAVMLGVFAGLCGYIWVTAPSMPAIVYGFVFVGYGAGGVTLGCYLLHVTRPK